MKTTPSPEPQPIRIEYLPNQLRGDDLLTLRTAANVARDLAAELLDTNPDDAAALSKLSRWARDFTARAEHSIAHPQLPAKPKRTPGPKFKVKHVYDANGLCGVDHDGKGVPCGKVRERKPRAGSSAESAAVGSAAQTSLPGAVS